jgi:hypothetical protein
VPLNNQGLNRPSGFLNSQKILRVEFVDDSERIDNTVISLLTNNIENRAEILKIIGTVSLSRKGFVSM